MKKLNSIYLLFALTLLFTGCKKEKTRLESVAGDLKEEIRFFCDIAQMEVGREPDNAAKIWCDASGDTWKVANSSEYDALVTPAIDSDVNYQLGRVHMTKDMWTAEITTIGQSDHDNICRILRDILGEPTTTRDKDGYEESEWVTDKHAHVYVSHTDFQFSFTVINIEKE